jgi:hypothetical protein
VNSRVVDEVPGARYLDHPLEAHRPVADPLRDLVEEIVRAIRPRRRIVEMCAPRLAASAQAHDVVASHHARLHHLGIHANAGQLTKIAEVDAVESGYGA